MINTEQKLNLESHSEETISSGSDMDMMKTVLLWPHNNASGSQVHTWTRPWNSGDVQPFTKVPVD
jgi:hypothetical protein